MSREKRVRVGELGRESWAATEEMMEGRRGWGGGARRSAWGVGCGLAGRAIV